MMIVALLWLTVSTPFVFASRQQAAKSEKIAGKNQSIPLDEDDQNPYGNTTEEKAPSGTSIQEEFLHEYHASEYFQLLASKHPKHENSGIYIAFHGELHVPPPNVA
ncbi:MAG TPA: hypothetical protein PLU37_05995 [Chitinophagaceae bacterium]|nr:hypothetical protein [Chitinophagaceae bacterium]HRX92968.1 hypothetical protein [Chitinophagaceae bacterium]